jgi:hypothetical protein
MEAHSLGRCKGLHLGVEKFDELFAVGAHGTRKRHAALQWWDTVRAGAMTCLHRG